MKTSFKNITYKGFKIVVSNDGEVKTGVIDGERKIRLRTRPQPHTEPDGYIFAQLIMSVNKNNSDSILRETTVFIYRGITIKIVPAVRAVGGFELRIIKGAREMNVIQYDNDSAFGDVLDAAIRYVDSNPMIRQPYQRIGEPLLSSTFNEVKRESNRVYCLHMTRYMGFKIRIILNPLRPDKKGYPTYTILILDSDKKEIYLKQDLRANEITPAELVSVAESEVLTYIAKQNNIFKPADEVTVKETFGELSDVDIHNVKAYLEVTRLARERHERQLAEQREELEKEEKRNRLAANLQHQESLRQKIKEYIFGAAYGRQGALIFDVEQVGDETIIACRKA